MCNEYVYIHTHTHHNAPLAHTTHTHTLTHTHTTHATHTQKDELRKRSQNRYKGWTDTIDALRERNLNHQMNRRQRIEVCDVCVTCVCVSCVCVCFVCVCVCCVCMYMCCFVCVCISLYVYVCSRVLDISNPKHIKTNTRLHTHSHTHTHTHTHTQDALLKIDAQEAIVQGAERAVFLERARIMRYETNQHVREFHSALLLSRVTEVCVVCVCVCVYVYVCVCVCVSVCV